MIDEREEFSMESVLAALKSMAKDKKIPGEYRDWARDGIAYARNNENAVLMDFPMNIYPYIRKEPMPEKVRDLVEGILINEIEANNTSAAKSLGDLYLNGMIGEQSYKKAMEYYRFAAEEGDDDAIENLGICYYYGENDVRDLKKAFECFSKGAFTGRVSSLYHIADMYRSGDHVEKDEPMARKIYSYCIDRINEDREHNVVYAAEVYLRFAEANIRGFDGQIDAICALYWAQKAEMEYRDREMNGDPRALQGVQQVVALIDECRSFLDGNCGYLSSEENIPF